MESVWFDSNQQKEAMSETSSKQVSILEIPSADLDASTFLVCERYDSYGKLIITKSKPVYVYKKEVKDLDELKLEPRDFRRSKERKDNFREFEEKIERRIVERRGYQKEFLLSASVSSPKPEFLSHDNSNFFNDKQTNESVKINSINSPIKVEELMNRESTFFSTTTTSSKNEEENSDPVVVAKNGIMEGYQTINANKNITALYNLKMERKRGRLAKDKQKQSLQLEFAKACLERHNELRKRHGSSSLVLSEKLSTSCEQYAEELAKMNLLVHSKGKGYGENLAMKIQTNGVIISGSWPVDKWYSEVEHYDFNSNEDQISCGHFTQVVWKASRQAGFGYACNKEGTLVYFVARYEPPGNVSGYWKENVFPPIE